MACADEHRSSCHQQAYVFFNARSRKFQYALISDWDQLAQVLANGGRLQSNKHKLAQQLVTTLNQMNLKQRAPLAFNQATSEFIIVDNALHLIHLWNIITGKRDKLRTFNNHFSGLFYSSAQDRVHALLWRMDTLFEWQQNKFVPTVSNLYTYLIWAITLGLL